MTSASIFSPSQLLALYKGLIHPCMEYGSHVWGSSIHTALFNRVESKAFRLINSPLTDYLDSLSHRRNVASLSIFYLYFHADFSSELANCMLPPLPRPLMYKKKLKKSTLMSHKETAHFMKCSDTSTQKNIKIVSLLIYITYLVQLKLHTL